MFRHRWLAPALVCAASLAPAHAVVDTQSPVKGTATTGPIGSLPVPPGQTPGGFLLQPPPGVGGAALVHEGSFSWAPNLAAAPTLTQSDECADLLPANLGKLATPALPLRLDQAHAASLQSLEQLEPGGLYDLINSIDDFLAKLDKIPGVQVPDPQVDLFSQRACLAYPPLHARWLARQYAPTLFTHHPSPRPFREIRERGARLYCAARAAQFLQGSKQGFSMGERVGFSANVLGKQIDFFVTEPSLTFDGPERFTAAGVNDGAQAFEVPLLLGTRITPIRGLGLPGFDEARAPLSLVTADSEIRNDAVLGLIVLGGGPALIVPGYRKTYQTVTHLDAIRSASIGLDLSGLETELFRVGPLAVRLTVGPFGYRVGGFGQDVLPQANNRVWQLAGLPPARVGRHWQHLRGVHDGRWQLVLPRFGAGPPSDILVPTWQVLDPDGKRPIFWREPFDFFFPPPLDIRLLQNDDHAVVSATRLELTGSLSGLLGGKFGPIEVSLEVVGTLSGEVTQEFVARDALLAQDQGGSRMTPITGLGVRPRQRAGASLTPASGELTFRLDLDIPFFDAIEWNETLFTVDAVTLANYDSDDDLPTSGADDSINLRLGTGSSQGNVMKKPVVFSHFPGTASEFQSFATDVDACLADPTENPPTPPPCEGTDDRAEVPSTGLCLYGPAAELEDLFGLALPPNVCANPSAYVAALALGPEQQACVQGMFDLLCSPVSKQAPLPSSFPAGNFSEVVSHVFELDEAGEQKAFQAMLKACTLAFDAANEAEAAALAHKLVATAACDPDDATLLNGFEILGAVNPSQAPPVTPGPACH